MLEYKIKPQNAANWLCVELFGRLKNGMSLSECPITPEKLSTIVARIEDSSISGKGGKEILDYLFTEDVEVDEAIEKLGLKQVNDDSAIIKIIDEVIEANPAQVEQYRAGKDKLIGFFVGQVMKNLKGANPQTVNTLLKEKLAK